MHPTYTSCIYIHLYYIIYPHANHHTCISIEWCGKLRDGIQVRPPATHGNRIVIQMHWDAAPIACENFGTLCTNGNGTLGSNTKANTSISGNKIRPAPIGDCGKPLSYQNSVVHRIVPHGFVQGGDFIMGNGSAGESIYNGKKFKDERGGLGLKHDRIGVVSMGNSGKNSNTSQFFITFGEVPQCDGKHVVFGQVVSGFDVLEALQMVRVQDEKPLSSVKITDCGAFYPLVTPGAGYWYDQPDAESFLGYTPTFILRPRIAVLSTTHAVCDKFKIMMGSNVVVTSISVDCEGSQDAASERVLSLLASFAIDLVLVAPAYKTLVDTLDLPHSWSELNMRIKRDEVVIVSKPIDAIQMISTLSWVGKGASFQLDGII